MSAMRPPLGRREETVHAGGVSRHRRHERRQRDHCRSGASFDKDYTLRLARAHEENGWDRVLFAYGSGSPDPNAAAAYIASRTETLQLLLAHRPNVSYPTFAAKTFATIDQISDGRVTVHFITGGTDHEQQREGDYLTHDERYGRTRECIQIVKQAWTVARAVRLRRAALPVRRLRQRRVPGAAAPAEGVVRRVLPRGLPGRRGRGRHLLPVGRAARGHGGADRVGEGRRPGGRADRHAQDPGRVPADHRADRGKGLGEGPRHRRPDRGPGRRRRRPAVPAPPSRTRRTPARSGCIAIAEEGERFDRALWTRTAAVTGGAGNSNALVGTPETVAQAILDYFELGVDIISMRGYDLLTDAIDIGQQVIPIVREDVAKRDRQPPESAGRVTA